ncbi:iron ABC transporter permease [Jannaschia sp. LMIT008]|uniref:ABC transporter permease n=1 Tax=Jannaschia maritima TaxID=3032585 RepID=UPI002811DAAC|nr:iron ABC transporter permease [Jannaschia sp. LMIT008]
MGIRRATRIPIGTAAAIVVAVLCALPHAGVLVAAMAGSVDTVSQLAATVLPRYVLTTLALVALVGAGTFVLGAATAWIVTAFAFPGRRLLEGALILPLALPGYVAAYAYTFLLDHPGPVQTALRDAIGWGPRDYWFPEIRSLGGAAAMLTLVLYPYVYLLARSAFLMEGAGPAQVARSLGRGPLGVFLTVTLPMARPAIAAGVLLAMMETLADFGTVAHFGVRTFATGIYTSWFTLADRAAAAQLALGLLAFALTLAVLERRSRGGARYATRGVVPAPRIALRGRGAVLAILACALPVALGLVVPVGTLAAMAAGSEQSWTDPRYLRFAGNTVVLGLVAAAVTVGAAVLLGSLHRVRGGRPARWALYLGRLGYAVPGGVIAVGLLVPFAAFDNALDLWAERSFGIRTGLLLTGSIWVLVLAYVIRFLAAAIGAYEGGLASVTPNVDAAARVLGRSGWGVVGRVHLPVLRPALVTAALIVFVDVAKELPATLIMRPFDFDTLAVQAYRLASDERLGGAAVPSLTIALIGLVPVLLLCLQVARRPVPGARTRVPGGAG